MRPATLSICIPVCASLLKANLFSLCLYSDIVASPDSSMIETPHHHVVSQHEELLQRCILRENTYALKFSERSSYNATVNQSKIRCIKDKHHMQSI